MGRDLKRAAIKRTASLKRRSPMRRRKRSTKYSRRERDTPRMLWVKGLLCALAVPGQAAGPLWLGPPPDRCARAIEAHHAGEHGVGQKATDDTVIPLCDHHHDALTDRRVVFAGWPRGAVKQWELAMIALYQRRYADETAGWRDVSEATGPLF